MRQQEPYLCRVPLLSDVWSAFLYWMMGANDMRTSVFGRHVGLHYTRAAIDIHCSWHIIHIVYGTSFLQYCQNKNSYIMGYQNSMSWWYWLLCVQIRCCSLIFFLLMVKSLVTGSPKVWLTPLFYALWQYRTPLQCFWDPCKKSMVYCFRIFTS